MESASAVSDAPSVAKPSALRESKKLCERGGCLSLMNAAGGAASAVVGAGSAMVGAMAEDSAGFTSVATRAFAVGAEDAVFEDEFAEAAFVGDAFALAVEAAESAEAGVDADEGTPRPSAAKADGPNNANSMAATATLTSLPLT